MNAPPPIAAERIPNHLAWAILSTIFSICLCCFVGGIAGWCRSRRVAAQSAHLHFQ